MSHAEHGGHGGGGGGEGPTAFLPEQIYLSSVDAAEGPAGLAQALGSYLFGIFAWMEAFG